MVRNVFYRGTGTGIRALMTVVLSSWVAFWAKASARVGAGLLLRPDITTSQHHQRRADITGRRMGRLAAGRGYADAMARRRQACRSGWPAITMLKRRVTQAQCGAALVDLTGDATILYLFLPIEAASDVASFFGLFVVAVGAGVLSHIPAGMGAFDGTLQLGLPEVDQTDVTTALVMYRALHTVLPFLLASLVLGAMAIASREQPQRAA